MKTMENTKSKVFCVGDIHGGYKALLQCLERSNFNKEEDTLISLGDICDGRDQVYECVEELLTIKDLVAIRGNHDCLDEETEVFTKRGWLKNKELRYDDVVIGIDENGFSNWQKINEIIRKESDHLNYYKNNRIDMAITDGHRILYKDGNIFKYKQTKDLKFNDRLEIPLANKTNQNDNNISNEWLQLLAWILTDSHIDKNGYITIYQSKKEHVDFINNLLTNLNIEFNHVIRNRNFIGSLIKNKKIKSNLPQHEFRVSAKSSSNILNQYLPIKSKIIPEYLYDLSIEKLKCFLYEIIKADGSWYNERNAILYKSYEFLSSIQPLFILAGYSAQISIDNRGDYRLNISLDDSVTIRQDVNKIERVSGKFDVWCLNVPFSNFLVRRNNKCFFTGNCWFYEFIRTGIHGSQWTQGAHKTMESYINNDSHKSENDKYTKTFKIPESHERFFGTQLNYYIDEKNRLFVHGGFNRHCKINKQPFEYIYYWDRDLWNQALSYEATIKGFKKTGDLKQPKFKTVDNFLEIYIGHTTTQFWNTTEYMKAANIYNVDCGAGGNGRLCMLNVDTKEAFYSDPLNEIYPEQKGRW